jgi:hypothetical protein
MNNNFFYRSSGSIGQTLMGIVLLVGFFIGLFWLARGIFSILTWAAPFMLILALIINYKVVTGYGEWLWAMLKKDTVMGIVYALLSFFGFPVLAAYLLFKALAVKKIARMSQGTESPFFTPSDTEDADYEILEEDSLDLKDPEEFKPYEELFDKD